MNETNETAEAVAPAVAAVPAVHQLADFCRALSAGDRRVELISIFHHLETVAGHTSDTEANYRARYAAVANRPAK